MAKPISHIVTRPGRVAGEPDVEIPVAEDLATTPGIPLREVDVSFYSRVDPLESQNVEKGADRDWVWSVYAPDVAEYIRGHDERMQPYVDEALVSGRRRAVGRSPGGRGHHRRHPARRARARLRRDRLHEVRPPLRLREQA